MIKKRDTAKEFIRKLLVDIPDGGKVDQEELNNAVLVSELDEETKKEAIKLLYSSIRPLIMKQEHKKVEVINFPEPVSPIEEIKVNNFQELKEKFDQLEKAIKELKIESPAVNVQVPPVNIPETVVNTQQVDLTELIKEIEKGLRLIRTNNKSNPLAVRMTDGSDWIKELKQQTAQTMQYLSDVSYVKNAAGMTVNPATSEGQASIVDAIGDISGGANYAVVIDTSGSTTYIGKAAIGSSTASAVWRISKIDESGNPEFVMTWADGNDNFDNVFNNRASLSYS